MQTANEKLIGYLRENPNAAKASIGEALQLKGIQLHNFLRKQVTDGVVTSNMKVNFYLRKPKEDIVSAIFASICWDRKRLIVFPKESIHRKNWDFDDGMPKSTEKNKRLEKKLIKAKLHYLDTHDELIKIHGKSIPPKIFKSAIDKINNPDPIMKVVEPILIADFFQTLIDDSKSGLRRTSDDMDYNANSVKPYKSAMEHFKKFSKRKKHYLTDINQTLINDFANYLNGFLALNTSAKYLTVFKTLISYATEKKLISINVSLENKVVVRKAKADDIYLTEDEIQAIMDIKHFPTKTFEVVRDLFVIGCNTGLRFEDYSILKAASVKGGYLTIDPKKLENKYYITTKLVIPVFPMFEEILKKYPNGFPKSPCNQVFNKTLKKIAKQIPSLNQDYEKKIIRCHKVERKPLKKWQMVVSHTCRRSFVTNMYLMGVPVLTIMAISGHRTEENFMKYVKADNQRHAEIMKKVVDENAKRKAELLKKKSDKGKKK